MSSELIPADRLELRLPDAQPVYDAGAAITEANRCLYCHDAPCVTACPTGIDVPGFIRKIGTGNLRGAARTILSANLLGYSCARACPVEVLCAGACVYHAWEKSPIEIGRLQRYAVEAARASGGAASLFVKAPANGKRVACVGGGPASLAVAGYLALEGVTVTIFERRAFAGGLNTTGVAPCKLHAEDALTEVEFIRSLGVEIRSGIEIGRDVTIEQLLREHDAVFLGVGFGADLQLGIEGEHGPGVVGATAWIEQLKLAPADGGGVGARAAGGGGVGARVADSGARGVTAALNGAKRALVVGGGNTAIDAARELAQLGVPEVSLVYRRTEAELSGYAHELEHARREGVRLVERAVPRAVLRNADGAVRALALVDGRELEADRIVVAIGQDRHRELLAAVPGLALDRCGHVVVDPVTGQTGNPRVFAGGDTIGGELVVTAVEHGKRAAAGIGAALGMPARPGSPMGAGAA